MNTDDDKLSASETQPVRSSPPVPPAAQEPEHAPVQPQGQSQAAPPAGPATWRERWRNRGDRRFPLAALLASTLAALIIGGLGGAAIHAVVDDDHGPGARVGRPDDFGRGPGHEGDRNRGGPGGAPGLLPPTIPPDTEDSTSPSPSSTPSSGGADS